MVPERLTSSQTLSPLTYPLLASPHLHPDLPASSPQPSQDPFLYPLPSPAATDSLFPLPFFEPFTKLLSLHSPILHPQLGSSPVLQFPLPLRISLTCSCFPFIFPFTTAQPTHSGFHSNSAPTLLDPPNSHLHPHTPHRYSNHRAPYSDTVQ